MRALRAVPALHLLPKWLTVRVLRGDVPAEPQRPVKPLEPSP